jgi:hypothetical protein
LHVSSTECGPECDAENVQYDTQLALNNQDKPDEPKALLKLILLLAELLLPFD